MQNNKELDILELIGKILWIFRRTWFWLTLVLVAVMALAGMYVKRTYVAVYSDKATFAVTREQNGESNYQYNKEATDELAVAFSSIVSSDVMMDAMCKDLEVEFCQPPYLHSESELRICSQLFPVVVMQRKLAK